VHIGGGGGFGLHELISFQMFLVWGLFGYVNTTSTFLFGTLYFFLEKKKKELRGFGGFALCVCSGLCGIVGRMG
jgi:hypothetical protein